VFTLDTSEHRRLQPESAVILVWRAISAGEKVAPFLLCGLRSTGVGVRSCSSLMGTKWHVAEAKSTFNCASIRLVHNTSCLPIRQVHKTESRRHVFNLSAINLL
jgi:hypothetical protein